MNNMINWNAKAEAVKGIGQEGVYRKRNDAQMNGAEWVG